MTCQPTAGAESRPSSPHLGLTTDRTFPTMMKLPPSLQLRDYYVVVSDPLAEWRCDQLTVRAISRDEARRVARERLAIVKRDDWSIGLVVEADVHERLDADGYV